MNWRKLITPRFLMALVATAILGTMIGTFLRLTIGFGLLAYALFLNDLPLTAFSVSLFAAACLACAGGLFWLVVLIFKSENNHP